MTSHSRVSRSQARLGRSIVLHLFLTPLALVWLFPLWMMVVFSTMPDNGIFSPDIELLPHGNFLDNVGNLQRGTNFIGAIGISVSVAVTYTFLSVMLTSMAGWALARYNFFGKGMVVAIIFGTITLPYAVVLIPQFIMVARDFKLANTWV
ncbi:MAG: carbohydrate ABC transporter permease, partial [Mesorhizobium sp.]